MTQKMINRFGMFLGITMITFLLMTSFASAWYVSYSYSSRPYSQGHTAHYYDNTRYQSQNYYYSSSYSTPSRTYYSGTYTTRQKSSYSYQRPPSYTTHYRSSYTPRTYSSRGFNNPTYTGYW